MTGEKTPVMALFDPHLYRAKLAFYPFGGGFDRLGIGHVGLYYQRLAAEGFYIALGTLQAVLPPRDEPDSSAFSACENLCCRASQAG